MSANELLPVQADDASGIRLTYCISALGLIGLTTYYGLDILRTIKDDAMVVSSIAGAVGLIVVQIVKYIFGCKNLRTLVLWRGEVLLG